MESLYWRPLPSGQIAFAEPAGRRLFGQALAAGTLESFFPLIEQFHTQAEPEFCGLGSLVMALNALGIDPGRMWRGPWRWFSEELLDCCMPLDSVRKHGVTLEELACLARCNGASVELRRASDHNAEEFRGELLRVSQGSGASVMIAGYARGALGQTGSGHFSPLGGYHAAQDAALVLDVARFKYPPHWAAVEDLHRAMLPLDPVTGRSRGWLVLSRGEQMSSLVNFIGCKEGVGVGTLLVKLVADTRAALMQDQPASLEAVLRIVIREACAQQLADAFFLRAARTDEHEALRGRLLQSLRESPAWTWAGRLNVGPVEYMAIWLLCIPESVFAPLPESLRREMQELRDVARGGQEFGEEVRHVRAQFGYLIEHAVETNRALCGPGGCQTP